MEGPKLLELVRKEIKDYEYQLESVQVECEGFELEDKEFSLSFELKDFRDTILVDFILYNGTGDGISIGSLAVENLYSGINVWVAYDPLEEVHYDKDEDKYWPNGFRQISATTLLEPVLEDLLIELTYDQSRPDIVKSKLTIETAWKTHFGFKYVVEDEVVYSKLLYALSDADD